MAARRPWPRASNMSTLRLSRPPHWTGTEEITPPLRVGHLHRGLSLRKLERRLPVGAAPCGRPGDVAVPPERQPPLPPHRGVRKSSLAVNPHLPGLRHPEQREGQPHAEALFFYTPLKGGVKGGAGAFGGEVLSRSHRQGPSRGE